MEDILFLIPPVFVIIVIFVLVPILNIAKKGSAPTVKKAPQDLRYNRQADAIHTTRDAAAERRHRLDQLKSLYEAGMMEKDEYNERVESVEADYRGRY
ncbi:MAG: hypothetical protein IJ283_07770 [Oscillospiraceae bacterium]|nr:hypothetical protein [Oscillospiraceae bacterium]